MYRNYYYEQWNYPMYPNWGHHYGYPHWNQMDQGHHGNPHYGHEIKDYGGSPFVVNMNDVSKENDTFRTALWTGNHLQVTLMSIDVGGDIGLEIHPDTDQFLRIEEGEGIVQMGRSPHHLDFQRSVRDDDAIMMPAGIWHNLINTGNKALKLYTIYAPPHHPLGTVHETKAIAMEAEEEHHES